jgi:hypothetical protein
VALISILILVSLFWIPNVFLGFHPHHDGLMIATLNLSWAAIQDSSQLPFNQYGPTWPLIYLLPNFIFEPTLVPTMQRLVSLSLVLLNCLLLYKTTLTISNRRMGLSISILYLSLFPFGQGMGIWPSVPGQVALSSLCYSFIQIIKTNRFIYCVPTSLALFLLIGSRFQIGIIAFFLLSLLMICSNRSKQLSLIVIITVFSFFCLSYWLQLLDSLHSTIKDSILFPFAYLNPGKTNWTFPRVSLLIAGLVILALTKASLNRPFFRVFILWTYLLIIAVLTYVLLLDYWLFRTWSSRLFVASCLVFIYFVFIKLIEIRKQLAGYRLEIAIILFGFLGIAQAFPLFDHFHFWWGLTPLLSTLSVLNTHTFYKQAITFISLGAAAVFIIQGVVLSAQSTSNYPVNSLQSLKMTPSQSTESRRELNFFRSSIPKSSRVLNLCADASPFLEPNYYKTASRFLVYWDFPINQNYVSSISNVEYITTCQKSTSKSDMLVNQIVARYNVKLISTLENVWQKNWQVYKIRN